MSSEEYIQIPREKRTPITDAGTALGNAIRIWVEVVDKFRVDDPGHNFGEFTDPEDFFISNFFKEAWDNPETNGDKSVDEIGLSLDGKRDPDRADFALLQVMNTIVAYSVQAMKAEKDGRHEEAWTYAADANYFSGILTAAWAEKTCGNNPALSMARKRHTETYKLKEYAIKYWEGNIDPNLSAQRAANELLKVVPLSHKKLAEYISEAKKK